MISTIITTVLGCICAMALSLIHPLWLIIAVVFLLILGRTALSALRNSETDALTGLWNLRRLENRRSRYEKYPRLAVLYLDLNDLKQVNDALGHEAGNTALRETAHALMDTDDDAYRIGGDEFLLISHEMDASELAVCWEDAQEMLTVSVSWGIAGGAGFDLDRLIRKAELDMYSKK